MPSKKIFFHAKKNFSYIPKPNLNTRYLHLLALNDSNVYGAVVEALKEEKDHDVLPDLVDMAKKKINKSIMILKKVNSNHSDILFLESFLQNRYCDEILYKMLLTEMLKKDKDKFLTRNEDEGFEYNEVKEAIKKLLDSGELTKKNIIKGYLDKIVDLRTMVVLLEAKKAELSAKEWNDFKKNNVFILEHYDRYIIFECYEDSNDKNNTLLRITLSGFNNNNENKKEFITYSTEHLLDEDNFKSVLKYLNNNTFKEIENDNDLTDSFFFATFMRFFNPAYEQSDSGVPSMKLKKEQFERILQLLVSNKDL